MTFIVSYQKFINSEKSIEMTLPTDEANKRIGDELATIDGVTYVALPDGTKTPDQPKEIVVSPVVLTDALRSAICESSPLVRLINEEVKDSIAQKYGITDEIRLLRTQPSSEFTAYNEYVEDCRAEGRAKKALLGL